MLALMTSSQKIMEHRVCCKALDFLNKTAGIKTCDYSGQLGFLFLLPWQQQLIK